MTSLEIQIRRHSRRAKPEDHLSQDGVDLARGVGAAIAPFNAVYCGPAGRVIETPVAMGFAISAVIPAFGPVPQEVHDEADWQGGRASYAAAMIHGKATRPYVRGLAQAVLEACRELPTGGRLLVVTHGGAVEAAMVGCLPNADHSEFTESSAYCGGYRLRFADDAFSDAGALDVG